MVWTRTRSRSTTSATSSGTPTPYRAFAIARALRDGMSVDEIHDLTQIDRWFLHAMVPVVDMHRVAQASGAVPSTRAMLREAKELGFCDSQIGRLTGTPHEARARAAPAARHRAAPGADRHARRRVSGRDELPLHDLPRDAGRHRSRRGARRSWCSARARTASAPASSSTGAASTRSGPRRSSGTRPSCSTTTPRRSAPTTTCATADLRRDQLRDRAGRRRARAAGRGRRQHGRADAEQPGPAAAPGRRADPRDERREHRPGRGPQEVLRAARRSRHRPAAVGAPHRRRGRGEARGQPGRVSRCSCARATCSPARR